jgi:hypothetical protein
MYALQEKAVAKGCAIKYFISALANIINKHTNASKYELRKNRHTTSIATRIATAYMQHYTHKTSAQQILCLGRPSASERHLIWQFLAPVAVCGLKSKLQYTLSVTVMTNLMTLFQFNDVRAFSTAACVIIMLFDFCLS